MRALIFLPEVRAYLLYLLKITLLDLDPGRVIRYGGGGKTDSIVQ